VTRPRKLSPQTAEVLRALAEAPPGWRYGYDLGLQVGLKTGTLYPILMRLADRGLLDARWEPQPPPGRPPRHLYRLTAAGLELAATLPAEPSLPVARPRLLPRPRLGGA
jgi:PadR family transcriptional regulator, regulatory protein PadR